MTKISNFKPEVSNKVLIFLAGLMWLMVGFVLMIIALSWLSLITNINIWTHIIPGIVMAIVIHRYGFSKIANKNLERLLIKTEKSCLFSFIPWKSYIAILTMIFLGATLRHSLIPKHYLAILYVSIGLALSLSSTRYFSTLFDAS